MTQSVWSTGSRLEWYHSAMAVQTADLPLIFILRSSSSNLAVNLLKRPTVVDD